MKFVIERKDLNTALSIVSRAIGTKSSIPILSCILITADDNGVKMTTNSLELCIETTYIDAQVEIPGKIALEAKLFSEMIRKLPDDYVTIITDNKNACTIKSGKTEFKLAGSDGYDFPDVPTVIKSDEYNFKQSDIKNMIKGTVYSVAVDGPKPILTGELFEIKNGFLTIVSLDGFRMSVRRLALENVDQNIEIVIPGKTAEELIKIFSSGTDDYVKFYFTDKHILFEIESCTVVSRLLEGDFVKYESIINIEPQITFQVNRSELLSGIERAALISSGNKRDPVKFSIEDEKITISSNTALGTAYDEVNGKMEGEHLEIAFNPNYLMDALKAIEDTEIVLNFTTALSPCIIKSAGGNEDYIYLILPLRLKA